MSVQIKRVLALLPILLLGVSACTGGFRERPSLVVYIVVDQLRGDLLEHYDSLFTGGFRRLHDEGFRFLSATHDHRNTATAVGHATLSTGVFPSRSGIVGNEWLERTLDGWRTVYSVEDTLTHILGMPVMGGRSSKNLLRGGLADWIVEADSGAVVVSASRKDRAAITMAGKTRGHVYWITENDGQWVTSSFYASDYPAWVERINRDEMPLIFGDSVWEQTIPSGDRAASRPDTSVYEGDGVHTFFPHRFYEEVQRKDLPGALNRWAYGQTHPDAALGIFGIEAIRALGLGKDEVTDYLGLSFSQTDAVGHEYGPLSREQLENLLHVDHLLEDLMAFLDEEVGEGRWVMALSGDHGVMTIPEYLVEEGEKASRANPDDFFMLRRTFQSFRETEGDPQETADSLVAALERLPFVADALSVLELTTPPPADSFVVLMRNSYHPDRWIGGSGSQGSGVGFRFVEGYYPDTSPRGTGHGTPYSSDRHVPLIFYGAGVEAGVSRDPVKTVDIAPTLAGLAGIATPPDLDGQPLLSFLTRY
ncbi:MAG: alkaline phosphatase family protein [Longimicrobiales bacterium]|nr:alkaline phosphatase family protein [Longimicrobiales bacterium]